MSADPVVLVFNEIDRQRFEEVRSGVKKVETRAATEKYRKINVGDTVRFVRGDSSFSKKVLRIYLWPSIESMLSEIPLASVMPDLQTLEQARERYLSYPNYKEKLAKYGLVGFEL